jgi:hypothetical protein
MADAKLLGRLIKRGLRTLLVVEFVAVLMYTAYRVHQPTTHNTVADRVLYGFAVMFHIINMLCVGLSIKLASLAGFFLALALLVSASNVIVDAYTLFYTVPRTFVVCTLVINAFFLCLDVVYVVVLAYVNRAFSYDAWIVYIRHVEGGRYDFWDLYAASAKEEEAEGATPLKQRARWERQQQKRETFKPRVVVGVIATVLPAELTLLFFYLLMMLSVKGAQFSGWLFGFHALTAAVAAVWLGMHTRGATEKQLTRAYQRVLTAGFFVILLDVLQLGVVGGADLGELIAVRALLLACALAYVVVMLYAGIEVVVPPQPHVIFYTLQYFVLTLLVVEIALVAFYFAYAYSVGAAPIMWSNLVHVATIVAAITALAAYDVLQGLLVLAGTAALVLVYDILIVGVLKLILTGMNSHAAHALNSAYVVQALLLVVCVGYLLAFVVAYLPARREDADVYRRFMDAEKLWRRDWIGFIWPARPDAHPPAGADTAEERDEIASHMSAEKLYFVVTYVIRAVLCIEIVLVVYLVLIFVDGPGPAWYEWFYMVHWFSILAAVLLMMFIVDTKMTLTFLLVAAMISLVNDVVLIAVTGFLQPVPAGTVAVQSFLIAADLAYIVFYAVIHIRMHPDAYIVLYTAPELQRRLTLNERLGPGFQAPDDSKRVD